MPGKASNTSWQTLLYQIIQTTNLNHIQMPWNYLHPPTFRLNLLHQWNRILCSKIQLMFTSNVVKLNTACFLGARRVSISKFQKLLIFWDCHTQQSLVFIQSGVNNIQSAAILARKHFIDERGQRRKPGSSWQESCSNTNDNYWQVWWGKKHQLQHVTSWHDCENPTGLQIFESEYTKQRHIFTETEVLWRLLKTEG